MKLIIVTALCACLLIAAPAQSQTNRASGFFSLPGGVVNNQAELKFKVFTDPLSIISVNGIDQETSTTVTIPRFGRSASYSFILKDESTPIDPASPAYEDFRLRFECISGCVSALQFTTVGYWSSSQGVVDKPKSELFVSVPVGGSTSNDETVNILLERADVFSGVIRLPEDVVANGNEQIELVVIGSAFSNKPEFSHTFSVTSGQTTIPFAIGVPRLSTVGGWNLLLRCAPCSNGVSNQSQFPTTASGNPLSLVEAESFFFRKFRNFSNLQLSFIGGGKQNAASLIGPLSILLLGD